MLYVFFMTGVLLFGTGCGVFDVDIVETFELSVDMDDLLKKSNINTAQFPGGKVPSLSQLVPPIEKYGLILSDCESLIRHYDKTLKAWLDRFLQNKEKVKNLFDKQFVRLFEFYLASCSAAFTYSDLLVYQLQIVKNYSALPSNTRNYIYQ